MSSYSSFPDNFFFRLACWFLDNCTLSSYTLRQKNFQMSNVNNVINSCLDTHVHCFGLFVKMMGLFHFHRPAELRMLLPYLELLFLD